MTEPIKITKKEQSKRNILYAQVTPELYKRVYAAAANTGFTMADIIRLCVERSIDELERQLLNARYGNAKK